jgi:MFS-type transporter involved in bile tolerance (Atg22 family)
MSNHDQAKISNQGVSLNRFAYCLDVVSALLLALYPFADTYFGSKKIMGVAFVLTIAVLLVCLLTPRTVRNRWLPFLVAFILLYIHGLFIPHL